MKKVIWLLVVLLLVLLFVAVNKIFAQSDVPSEVVTPSATVVQIVTNTTESKSAIPTIHAGSLYSVRHHQMIASATFDLASFGGLNKDLIFIEGGWAGQADNADNEFVGVISVNITKLQASHYVKWPVLDLFGFRPAIYCGLGPINGKDLSAAKLDYGVGATVFTYKF